MRYNLVIITVVLLVLTVALRYVSTSNEVPSDLRVNHSIAGNLDITKIDKITIQQEQQTIALSSSPSGVWTLKQQHGFLANIQEITRLLENLQSIKVASVAYKTKKQWANLHLLTPVAKRTKAHGIQLSLFQQQEKVIDLLIGQQRQTQNGVGGQYVRFLPEEKVYLLQDEFVLPTENTSWLNTKVLHIQPDEVQAFTMISGKNKWHFERKTLKDPFAYSFPSQKPNQEQIQAYLKQFAPVSIQNVHNIKQTFLAERQLMFTLFDQTQLHLQFELAEPNTENNFYTLKWVIQNPTEQRWKILANWNEDYGFKLSTWQGNYLWQEQALFFKASEKN